MIRTSNLPLLLCAMALASGLAAPGCGRRSPVQQERTFTFEKADGGSIRYWLYLPPGYGQHEKRWPMLLFLHGAGESGEDLEKVKKHGPPKIVETGKDFPLLVVSPQSRRRGWRPEVLRALIDHVVSDHQVDPDRIYVTGLSMGGFGTWALAAADPERIAAIVPICGGGDPNSVGRIGHLPAWVFHGGKDDVVPISESKRLVQAIRASGGNVRFTIYPQADHDSWTRTYDNPRLYEWLLEQKRSPGNRP
jgi:predicted peptidase